MVDLTLTPEDLTRIIYDTQVTFYNAITKDKFPHWETLENVKRQRLIEELEIQLHFGPTDPHTLFAKTQEWGVKQGYINECQYYEKLPPELKALADVYNLLLNLHRPQVLAGISVEKEGLDTSGINNLSFPL